jgi:FixJ family two-component response regulator
MSAKGLVLVVDDDASVRTGLTRALRTAGYAVEAFGSAKDLLVRIRTLGTPCCVVSDIRMPAMDGLSLQEELVHADAPVAVVFLTGFADVPIALRAMKHGAVDLLEKPARSDVLLPAVASALQRARELAERRRRADELRSKYEKLTQRERQVFALVTAGLLNKQVGFELGTSEKTVKVQRAHVVEKMGARSLADLVRMADHLGLGPVEPEAAEVAEAAR